MSKLGLFGFPFSMGPSRAHTRSAPRAHTCLGSHSPKLVWLASMAPLLVVSDEIRTTT
jgi:hypothetical protein